MPPKKETITYTGLMTEISQKRFRPIYVLQGEEPYYIDSIADKIIDTALTEDERDFNLTVMYGVDANIRQLIADCKRFPVMAERQVVILREAQNASKREDDGVNLLKYYAEKPMKSTILVICNKGGKLTKAEDFLKQVKASDEGVVFDSKKETEGTVVKILSEYVTSKGCNIDEKSKMMLRDYVGTDVARLFGEVDKLCILLGADKRITPELIERNIGISKDYNNFELEDALLNRNSEKAFRIIDYFQKNPKNNPVQPLAAILFGLYANLLLVRTSRSTSPYDIMDRIGTTSKWRADKFISAARNYSTLACVNIISAIRRFDANSKGVGSRQDAYDLLKELIFYIMNS